jgi:hypothetical protein
MRLTVVAGAAAGHALGRCSSVVLHFDDVWVICWGDLVICGGDVRGKFVRRSEAVNLEIRTPTQREVPARLKSPACRAVEKVTEPPRAKMLFQCECSSVCLSGFVREKMLILLINAMRSRSAMRLSPPSSTCSCLGKFSTS